MKPRILGALLVSFLAFFAAGAFADTPTTSSTTIMYTEPTTTVPPAGSTVGLPLTDLTQTRIYWKVDNGVETIVPVPATKPTGGGLVTYTGVVAPIGTCQRGTISVSVTAVNPSAESARFGPVLFVKDRTAEPGCASLPPSAPSGLTVTSGATPTPVVPTVVNFDTPVPPGGPNALLGVFQGIDFGSQWRWETAQGTTPTNICFFDSSTGTTRSFTFAPAPKILISLSVFSSGGGTLTLSDNLGQTITVTLAPGIKTTVTTGWQQASTTVTDTFSGGWNHGVDDITYR